MDTRIRIHAAAPAFGAALLAALLSGCGSDGAGAPPGGGATQTSPSAGAGGAASTTFAITVSGAVPATGNTAVSGTGAVSSVISGTFRQVTVDGVAAANGYVHRFSIDYDGVTGVPIAVTHRWGASADAFEAITQCVGAVTAAGQVGCGNAVSIDVAAGRVNLSNAVLRGSGVFASILTGRIPFTTR